MMRTRRILYNARIHHPRDFDAVPLNLNSYPDTIDYAPVDPKQVMLKVENLSCERNDRSLFSGLSFDLKSGDLIQVDGPNGSGKTTLLRTVCGLLPPDEGTIYWCGTPIHRNRFDYLSELVFVGHKHGIKDELTAKENLDMDGLLAGHRSKFSTDQALQEFGVDGCRDQLCRQLSAGQRQRVALARLLVSIGKFWVLDEPLTALDRAAQNTVRDLLSQHVDNGGMVLITSHQTMDWGGMTRKTIRLGYG